MVSVETFFFNDVIPELQLAGMLCYMCDVFGDSPIIDLEISMTLRWKFFPSKWQGSFTLFQKKEDIVKFCSQLKVPSPNGPNFPTLEVYPLFKDTTRKVVHTYYLDPKDTDIFIVGYAEMGQIIGKYLTMKEQESHVEQKKEWNERANVNSDYKDEWKATPNYQNKATLFVNPKDGPNAGSTKNKNFSLPFPAYGWDLPSRPDAYMEQQVADYISLFLRDCSAEDHLLLQEKETYLRFFLYQDTPTGNPYMYAYIRPIEECTYPSHKVALTFARKSGKYLPVEINNAQRGFFYEVDRIEWQKKLIEHVGDFA